MCGKNMVNETVSLHRQQYQALLSGYKEQAEEERIPADLPRMARVSEAELVSRRRTMRLLRAYSTHQFTNMAQGMLTCESAFLLLDPDGCTVQMRTSGSFEKELQQKGITLGAVWRTDVTGSDAVSVGNAERCAMESSGNGNYLHILQDLALYYAPLQVMEEGILRNMGGVAWICREQDKSEAFMLTALGIAGALNIRVSTAWNTSDSFEGDTRGVVQLDLNTRNGIVSVTHHNKKFFDILEIPRMDRWSAYFRPAAELIDPPPVNEKLWEIIEGHREVKDREMTIQVQGRKVSRVITTVPTEHPELKSRSVVLYITTRKDISHQVADKTGNNAVISFSDVVGSSAVMKNRIKRAKLLANTDSNIMILGESGVGKDVFAQAIHNQSHRKNGPFVSVNCGALPRDLIASELFGYDAGAFTGAKKQGNIGKFELAEGGTLFLDEIGEMPLDLQATLLRAVEQKQFMRLGSSKVIKADVRIISATNVDINQMIREKRFRSDLYYRLSTMSMDLPPLRERNGDVILLAESFIRRISRKVGRQDIMELTPEAKAFLNACPWQGNVRELQNLMDCLVQLYPDHLITPELIRENINPAYFEGAALYTGPAIRSTPYAGRAAGNTGNAAYAGGAAGNGNTGNAAYAGGAAGNAVYEGAGSWSPASGKPGPDDAAGTPSRYDAQEAAGEEIRRDLPLLTKAEILEALEICEGNRSKAAKYLSVGRRTLYRYIDRLGIGEKTYDHRK